MSANMSAAERLADLNRKIAGTEFEITGIRRQHDSAVSEGLEAAADRLFDRAGKLERDLAKLRARRPVVENLADDERKNAALQAAEALAQKANAMRAGLIQTVTRCTALADNLKQVTDTMDENAAIHWFAEALQAAEAGAPVNAEIPPGLAGLADRLVVIARKMRHIVDDFSARSASLPAGMRRFGVAEKFREFDLAMSGDVDAPIRLGEEHLGQSD